MQAALLMTEELLGFLVRPSYYRKLIHTSHRARAGEGTAASDPAVRKVGRRPMLEVSYIQGRQRYCTNIGVTDSEGSRCALVDVVFRRHSIDSSRQLQSIERRHTWRRATSDSPTP